MRVSVSYSPSRKMFSQATHASWGSQGSFQILVVLMIGLWVGISFALGAGAQLSQHLPTFTYMLMAIAFYFLYPSLVFATDAKWRSDVRFDFNSSGVSYRFAEKESSVPWRALTQAVETKDFYVLALPEKVRVALPKAAFDADAERRFRLLAATSGVPIRS